MDYLIQMTYCTKWPMSKQNKLQTIWKLCFNGARYRLEYLQAVLVQEFNFCNYIWCRHWLQSYKFVTFIVTSLVVKTSPSHVKDKENKESAGKPLHKADKRRPKSAIETNSTKINHSNHSVQRPQSAAQSGGQRSHIDTSRTGATTDR